MLAVSPIRTSGNEETTCESSWIIDASNTSGHLVIARRLHRHRLDAYIDQLLEPGKGSGKRITIGSRQGG
jgi:hypothetical protein